MFLIKEVCASTAFKARLEFVKKVVVPAGKGRKKSHLYKWSSRTFDSTGSRSRKGAVAILVRFMKGYHERTEKSCNCFLLGSFFTDGNTDSDAGVTRSR